MPKGESTLRVSEEKEPKKYTTQEIETKFGSPNDDGNNAPTGSQAGIGAFPEIQKIIDEENQSIKKGGQLLHLTDERRRLQKDKRHKRDLELLEEGRKRLGGFTGENQLEKLQAQLEKDIILDKAKDKARYGKPEPEETWPKPHEFKEISVADELEEAEKKLGPVLGYVLEKDAVPPLLPEEELQKLQKEYDGVTKELKTMSSKLIRHELEPDAILPLTKRQLELKTQIKKLEAFIKGEPTMADKIAAARAKAIEELEAKQKTLATEKPIENKEPPKPKTHETHEVYDRGSYRGPIGGIGLGNVAGAMERGSGVLRHYAGPRAGEVESAPERTNEEALLDLDQDLTKEKSPKNLLLKLFHGEESKSKIHLDNEEHREILLADKMLLESLEDKKWNGDLSILKEVVGKISLEKSDRLVEHEHGRGFFKRLLKIATPQEKLLKKQMEALDDFAGKLIEGGKEGSTSPQTNRLLRTMTRR